MSIRLSLVGAGYIGRLHIAKVIENALADLVGFYDIDPTRAKIIESEFGVRRFLSVDELVRCSDAVIVSSPTSTHYDYARMFLEMGLDVFVEKPLAENSTSALELAELAEKKNLVLQVGHIERFNPAYRAAKKMIRDPLFIEAHRMSFFKERGVDVAVVLDLMVHDVDLVLDIFGVEPVQIYASAVPVVTKSEDIANARLEFPQGKVVNLTASRISLKPLRKMRIFESNFYTSIDFEKRTIERLSIIPPESGRFEEITVTDGVKFYRTEPDIQTYDPITMELSHFVECVENRAKPVISGFEAYRAISIVEKIIEISRRCRPISL